MSCVSLLVVAVLAQPPSQRAEVHGGGPTFWYAQANSRWEQVRADVLLQAQRSSGGEPPAQLMVTVLRADELWTVELSEHRPDEVLVDADVDGPGGRLHAAVALRAKARVTRGGQVLTQTARIQAFALTTGFHADDGTFRMLPQPRSNDFELLVHLEDVPGEGSVDVGFDWPEIWLDGAPLLAHREAVATADRSESPPGGGGGPSGAAEYISASETTRSGPRIEAAVLTGAAGEGPVLAATQGVSGTGLTVNAVGSAPSVAAPWSDGVQAISGTGAPVNSAAQPSSVVGSWNGGAPAGAPSFGCGSRAVLEPSPPAMALRSGASPLSAVAPKPTVEPAPLVVASPRNGAATPVVPVTAGPPNPAGGPTPLVMASPWYGGTRRGDAALGRVEGGVPSGSLGAGSAPTSSLSWIQDVPLAGKVSGAVQ